MPSRAQVTTEKQRDAFLAALAGDEEWLYSDEGEAAQAPAFRCGGSQCIPLCSQPIPYTLLPEHRAKGVHTRSC